MNSIFDSLKNTEVKEYELGKICEIFAGTRFKQSQYVKNGTPILNVRDIKDGKIDETKCLLCNPDNHKNLIWVKSGDVVVANVGSAGKIGINRTNHEFILDKNVFKLKPNEEILNRRYLYHFLANCEKQISSIVKPGIIPLLTKASFAKLKILIPALDIQKRIAETLDKFDEIEREIELRQKQYEYYREQIINH